MHRYLPHLLLLLCTGCSHSDHWALHKVESGDKQYNSTKLAYRASDPVNGIDLELLRTSDHLHAYLNIHSLPIPAAAEDPHAVWVTLGIEEEKLLFKVHRHEGGQRLLLPDEMTERIIAALSQDKTLQIHVPGYSASIEAKGFEDKFRKMDPHTLIYNPFHLPF